MLFLRMRLLPERSAALGHEIGHRAVQLVHRKGEPHLLKLPLGVPRPFRAPKSLPQVV